MEYVDLKNIRICANGNKSTAKTEVTYNLSYLLSTVRGWNVAFGDCDLEEDGLWTDGYMLDPPFFTYLYNPESKSGELLTWPDCRLEYPNGIRDIESDVNERIKDKIVSYGELLSFNETYDNQYNFYALIKRGLCQTTMLPELEDYVRERVRTKQLPTNTKNWLEFKLKQLKTDQKNMRNPKHKEKKYREEVYRDIRTLEYYLNNDLFNSPFQKAEKGNFYSIFSSPATLQRFKYRVDTEDGYFKKNLRKNSRLVDIIFNSFGIDAILEDNELGMHRSGLGSVRLNNVDFSLVPLISDPRAAMRFNELVNYLKEQIGISKIGVFPSKLSPTLDGMKIIGMHLGNIGLFDGEDVQQAGQHYIYFENAPISKEDDLFFETGTKPIAYYMFLQEYALTKSLEALAPRKGGVMKLSDLKNITETELSDASSSAFQLSTKDSRSMPHYYIPPFDFELYIKSIRVTLDYLRLLDMTLARIATNRRLADNTCWKEIKNNYWDLDRTNMGRGE